MKKQDPTAAVWLVMGLRRYLCRRAHICGFLVRIAVESMGVLVRWQAGLLLSVHAGLAANSGVVRKLCPCACNRL